LDVLAGVDHLGDVPGDPLDLLLQAVLRDRLVGADDLQLRIRDLGELDRGLDRLCGGVGPVGSNHDAIEHLPS
jgi:hypothetical protein